MHSVSPVHTCKFIVTLVNPLTMVLAAAFSRKAGNEAMKTVDKQAGRLIKLSKSNTTPGCRSYSLSYIMHVHVATACHETNYISIAHRLCTPWFIMVLEKSLKLQFRLLWVMSGVVLLLLFRSLE